MDVPFNEDSLRDEIAKVWGEHGAHMDVYDDLLRRARPRFPLAYRSLMGHEATTHAMPEIGKPSTPCCDRTPFELPLLERITSDPALVTCSGARP